MSAMMLVGRKTVISVARDDLQHDFSNGSPFDQLLSKDRGGKAIPLLSRMVCI